MKQSKRNLKNQEQNAKKVKPSGNSKYAKKNQKRKKGIPNPNSPIYFER